MSAKFERSNLISVHFTGININKFTNMFSGIYFGARAMTPPFARSNKLKRRFQGALVLLQKTRMGAHAHRCSI